MVNGSTDSVSGLSTQVDKKGGVGRRSERPEQTMEKHTRREIRLTNKEKVGESGPERVSPPD